MNFPPTCTYICIAINDHIHPTYSGIPGADAGFWGGAGEGGSDMPHQHSHVLSRKTPQQQNYTKYDCNLHYIKVHLLLLQYVNIGFAVVGEGGGGGGGLLTP